MQPQGKKAEVEECGKQTKPQFFFSVLSVPTLSSNLTTLILRHSNSTKENERQCKEYFFQQPCRLEIYMQLQPKLIIEMGTLATLFMKSMFFIKITSYSRVRTDFFFLIITKLYM